MMTKVFISYSHKDEQYRTELEKHLSALKRNYYIDTWVDRKILPGEEWDKTISSELLSAKIILLLISSDFISSDFCYDLEMKAALNRHESNQAIVIPIILRFCDWEQTPFSKLQGLPTDCKPIDDWDNVDKAFLNVVEGIKTALRKISNLPLVFGGRPEFNPSEQIVELRTRVLSAESARDFRKLLFDITELKRVYPSSFELEELERTVHIGLSYENRPTACMTVSEEELTYQKPGKTAESKRPDNKAKTSYITLILLILIGYLLFYYSC